MIANETKNLFSWLAFYTGFLYTYYTIAVNWSPYWNIVSYYLYLLLKVLNFLSILYLFVFYIMLLLVSQFLVYLMFYLFYIYIIFIYMSCVI